MTIFLKKPGKRVETITSRPPPSVKENSAKKKFDTVFVITRLIGVDTVFDCLK